MSIQIIVEKEIENQKELYSEINHNFNDLLFFILLNYKTKQQTKLIIKIPLKNSMNLDLSLYIKEDKREIIDFIRTKIIFDYEIVDENKNTVISSNSLKEFMIEYNVLFGKFIDDLEDSFKTFISREKNKIIDFRDFQITFKEKFQQFKNNFNKFKKPIELELSKIDVTKKAETKIDIKELFLYKKQGLFISGSSIEESAKENIIINLRLIKEKGKKYRKKDLEITYLFQIGDLIYDNLLLRKISPFLSELQKKNKYSIFLAGIKNIKIEDKRIVSVDLETIYDDSDNSQKIKIQTLKIKQTLDLGIDSYKYKVNEFRVPDIKMIPIESRITLSYIESLRKTDKLKDDFIVIDIQKSKVLKHLLKEKGILSKEILSISYFEKPELCLIFEYLRDGKDYGKIFLLSYKKDLRHNQRTVIKDVNLSLDEKKIENNDFNDLIKHNIILNKKEKENYIYDYKEKDFIIIESINFSKEIPYTKNPFNLTHFPISYEKSSIIQFKRNDMDTFTENNRYIINKFLFEEIPKNSLFKDLNSYLMLKNNLEIKKLYDYSKGLKEFGFGYKFLFSDFQFDEYKDYFEEIYEQYAEKDDIIDDIIELFDQELKNLYFQGYKDITIKKFENIKTEIKKLKLKKIPKYKIEINYNFFQMGSERLSIIYYKGHKFFWVFLRSKNQFHLDRFRANFIEEKKNYISKENVRSFIENLMKYVYPYILDPKLKTIKHSVNAVKVRLFNIYHERETEKVFQIGDFSSKFAFLIMDYLVKENRKNYKGIIERIDILKSYDTNEINGFFINLTNVEENGKKRNDEVWSFIMHHTLNNEKIIEIKVIEERKIIELSDFYKEIDEVYIRIGEEKIKGNFINISFDIFKKNDKADFFIINNIDKTKIESIKISSTNEEVYLSTEDTIYYFKIDELIEFKEKDRKGEGEYLYYRCFGIAEDLDDYEEINSVLMVFDNLEQIYFEKGKENPDFSTINEIGKIEKVLISKDNTSVKIYFDKNDWTEFNLETQKFDIYKKIKNSYKYLKTLPIILFYRDQQPTEISDFEEIFEFELFKIPTKKPEDYKKYKSKSDIQDLIRISKKDPDNIPYKELVEEKGEDEEVEEIIEFVSDEDIIEVNIERKKKKSPKDLGKEYIKETGKRTIYRGKETKGFQEWKIEKGYLKLEEDDFEEEEEIEAEEEIEIEEGDNTWDSFIKIKIFDITTKGSRWKITPKGKRDFSEEEESFYKNLSEKIGIDFMKIGTEYIGFKGFVPSEKEEDLELYLENFYEFYED